MLNRLLVIPIIIFYSCQNNSYYDKWVKDEMANGRYLDSIQFGLKLGDSKKDFFIKAWELNNEGKVTHGPNNDFISYEIENMPEGEIKNR